MRKYIIKILNVMICITCFFLCYGCNDQAEKQQKPTVIRKKIVFPKKEKQQIENDEKIENSNHETIKKDLKPKADTINTAHNQKPDQEIELSETTITYKVEGRIDPFAQISGDGSSAFLDQDGKKKEHRIPLTPIEKVDLSQLKLVGIIFASSGNKALVEDTSGKGFIVKKGTHIGINSGRVIKILKNLMVVEEKAENILGKTTLVKKELKLQKSPGEK